MTGPERRSASIGGHIESIATRTAEDSEALLSAVRDHCWPSDPTDRTDTCAVEWVRRWRPTRGTVLGPGCACASGVCVVCN